MARAIGVRPPIHRLLRQVHRAGKKLGVRGSQQHAVAGLAQSEHGDPAVDFFGFDPRINLGRDKRQPEADERALDQITTHSSCLRKED